MDLETGREPSSRELALKNLRDSRRGDMTVQQHQIQEHHERQEQVTPQKKEEEEEEQKVVTSPGPMIGSPGKELSSLHLSQSPTLSVHQFKALWGSLQVLGSFQCKLRSAPNMQTLTQHLRKQNFHVVFAASPSDTETEVSICNIRPNGDDAWFMARFLFSKSIFSAAMKAQDAAEVEGYVKRFALARVLKIDTSSVS